VREGFEKGQRQRLLVREGVNGGRGRQEKKIGVFEKEK